MADETTQGRETVLAKRPHVQKTKSKWIPAFAGMTEGFRRNDRREAFAEITASESSPEIKNQSSRSAVVTGNLAARNAGNNPPMNPIASAHFNPLHTSAGDTLNAKTTWLKFAPSVDTV